MSGIKMKASKVLGDLLKAYDPKKRSKQGFVLEGGGGCFSPHQKIITQNGSKKISELSIDEKVLSYNVIAQKQEYMAVEQVHIHNNQKKCYRITLKNGEVIECTSDHRFFYRGGWVEISEIIKEYYGDMEGSAGI